jgi:N-acyl-L-homoserine lactone synthetase
MIEVIEKVDYPAKTLLLESMFRQRARIFGEELGWDVTVVNGLERDEYDDLDPVYLVDLDDSGNLIGSLRLLPTTGPILLEGKLGNSFSDSARNITHPSIWECSRLCADGALVASRLVIGIGEIGIERGIESVIGVLEQKMIRLYRRLGCELHTIEEHEGYGHGPITLASFPVEQNILEPMKNRLGL